MLIKGLGFARKQAGATLVEVLMAIALTGILLPALATALVTAHAGKATSIQQLQAESVLQEATEAVRSVREKGWVNIATDGTYHPVIASGAWTLVSGSATSNGLTTQIVISTPQRNTTTSALVTSGGTNDPSTKQVVVTVSWTTPYNASVSEEAYFTRWQNNAVWTQTTQADFTAGTLTNTCATTTCASSFTANTVQLADTPATWQLPSVYGTGYNITGNVAGNDVFIATIGSTPYAFVGYATGLAIVNISNPAAPTLTATYTTTAAVNGVYVSGNYAYLATSVTNGQLTIVNVTTPASPTLAKAFQITDNSNSAANAVFVTGGYAYVVKNQVTQGLFTNYGEFNIINVTTPTNPTASGSYNIGANCTGVVVSGTSAYVTTSKNNAQLTVVNVNSKTNPAAGTTVNLGATANDITLNAAGTTAYIATANNTANGELRIYTVTPAAPATAPVSVGNYEVGGVVSGVAIDTTNPNYLVLATQVAAKQAIIVNISTPATPTLVNNVTLGGNGNKVMVVGPYAYVGTADTTKELTVVYAGYRPTGTFESSSFDATGTATTVGYNYLTATTTVPTGASLKFQVATNTNNSTWNYVGPDGTATTYFTPSGTIPLSITSGRYIRYKAYFTPTANGQQTPIINDVSVTYSP